MEENSMLIYKIAKTILAPIYRVWYRPTIIGKENIPKEGPIIIVGNHIHIMDQCNIIISTKRNIHYMAKKEYFDPKYKEGKFPWFFKGVGCIPVDREKKDEEAVEHALEVLSNNHALGLFPEGTRNALKDNTIKEYYNKYNINIDYKTFYKKMKKNKASFLYYLEELLEKNFITKDEFVDNICDAKSFLIDMIINKRLLWDEYYEHYLLPLKFGAVSMAKKTNALIVPYAITGNYKLFSKDLTIRIGKPFKVENDLETANEKLKEEIIKLIKENENSGK